MALRKSSTQGASVVLRWVAQGTSAGSTRGPPAASSGTGHATATLPTTCTQCTSPRSVARLKALESQLPAFYAPSHLQAHTPSGICGSLGSYHEPCCREGHNHTDSVSLRARCRRRAVRCCGCTSSTASPTPPSRSTSSAPTRRRRSGSTCDWLTRCRGRYRRTGGRT
jgi:hypothetical protein